MPSVSEKQRRAMWAAAEGKSNLGIPKSVGEEFVSKDSIEKQESKKEEDINGYWTFKNNPVTKEGVSEYLGKDIIVINEDGEEYYPFDSHEIVPVYMPGYELNDPECLKSFSTKPIIEDHTMLGFGEGLSLPDDIQFEGVTDSNTNFEKPYLNVNLVAYTKRFKDLFDIGKRELSAGYRCKYELSNGIFEDIPYKVIQRQIRCNHIAIVDQGRKGPDVAVLDSFIFTCDSKGWEKMVEKKEEEIVKKVEDAEEKKEDALEKLEEKKVIQKSEDEEVILEDEDMDVKDMLKEIMSLLRSENKIEKKVESMDEECPEEEVHLTVDEEEKEKEKEKEDKKSMDTKPMDSKAMDSIIDKKVDQKIKQHISEIKSKEDIFEKLKPFTGVFDHKVMSKKEVIRKGLSHFGIKASEGLEEAALQGFLLGRNSVKSSIVMDQKNNKKTESDSSFIDILGGK